MTPALRPPLLLSTLVVLGLIAAACGGGSSADSRLPALFDAMPASALDDGPHFASDWVLAADQAGIDVDSCDEGSGEFFVDLLSPDRPTGAIVPPSVQSVASRSDELRSGLGFGICEVLAVGTAGSASSFGVFSLSVEDSVIDRALRGDPEWSDDLVVEDDYYTWDIDGIDPTRNSAAHPIGQAGQVAVDEGVLIRSFDEAQLEEVLAGQSLLGVGSIGASIDIVADNGAHTVLVEVSPELTAGAAFVGADPLLPYEVLTVGVNFSRNQTRLTAVLAHSSIEDASRNKDRLQDMLKSGVTSSGTVWSEFVAIDSIKTEGNLVIAKLDPVRQSSDLFSFALTGVVRGDGPFQAG